MKKIDEKMLYSGKWIAMKETTFENDGKLIKWESIERTNTSKTVVILAKLVPSNRYVIIKQFRQALEKFVVGFPAGLLEQDDVEKEAIRELQEETGYFGKVVAVSPALKSNPALLNDEIYFVNMEVDENLEENSHPCQHLEDAEMIEIVLKTKEEVRDYILKEEKNGSYIGIGPWYIFCGLF